LASAVNEGDGHDPSGAGFAISDGVEAMVLRLTGAWTTRGLGAVSTRLTSTLATPPANICFDLSEIAALDSAGAWALHRTRAAVVAQGGAVTIRGASPGAAALLQTVARHDRTQVAEAKAPGALFALTERLGRGAVDAALEARDLTNFLGYTCIVFAGSLLRPTRIRVIALVSQMEQAGLNALPIVGLISFLVGLVLAYQGADQLSRFGAQIFTVNLVAIGVLREMGILLTAIIVAGRSGSAFTAQIGTMQVNEEIDALRTIGLDPMEVLVMPRVLGLVIVMPLLTFYADIMGILGGGVMVTLTLDMSITQFVRQLADAARITDFWVGIIKAPLFAFIIAMVGCFEGMRVSRSAESVGRQTTRAVVEAIFLVIVLDAILSIFFSVIGF
jgi:phospholipid/cholesterol/gamma-HCH transport system permease protein